jgi:hypothetical protein
VNLWEERVMKNESLTLVEANQKVLKLSQDLLSTHTIVVRGVSFPKEPGIYLWRSREDERIVYVGVGNGNNGLSGRIKGNHLSPGYKKSVLRIKVSKEYSLNIGLECIKFISENFRIGFLPYPNKHVSEAAEKLLIAAFRPKYNA